jgi:hypothetical protein
MPRAAGGLARAVADRIWSDTLLAVEGGRASTKAKMFEGSGPHHGALMTA